MKFEIQTETETIYIENVTKLCYNEKSTVSCTGNVYRPYHENVENVWRLED